MTGTSGPTSRGLFATYDPDSSSWKTWPATGLWGSTEYSETWPRSGSMRSGRAFERPTSAPPISASGSSSSPGLPTPTARDYKGEGYTGQLPNAVSLLPTPRAADGTKGGPNQRGSAGDLMLPSAVMLLPTPRASDTGTPGRRAGEGFRPPLSQVLLPTPTATPYGNNQSPTPGARTRPGLNSMASTGAFTDPPSTDGPPSSDGQLLIPLSPDEEGSSV